MNYLLHFERPYAHAQHYLGFAEQSVQRRITRHRKGLGSPLVAAVVATNIPFVVARVWPDNSRSDERRLKNRGSSSRHCPICRGEISYDQAKAREGRLTRTLGRVARVISEVAHVSETATHA